MRSQKQQRGRKGLTLVEILIVVVIIGIILVAGGIAASSQVKRANRESVTNELQVMATNLTDAYYDLGNPILNDEASFTRFLNTVVSEYANFTITQKASGGFDLIEIAEGWSFYIEQPKDAYEQRYQCWFTTRGANRYVMIASGGDNGVIESGGYATSNYSDDIVLIVRPKVDTDLVPSSAPAAPDTP